MFLFPFFIWDSIFSFSSKFIQSNNNSSSGFSLFCSSLLSLFFNPKLFFATSLLNSTNSFLTLLFCETNFFWKAFNLLLVISFLFSGIGKVVTLFKLLDNCSCLFLKWSAQNDIISSGWFIRISFIKSIKIGLNLEGTLYSLFWFMIFFSIIIIEFNYKNI